MSSSLCCLGCLVAAWEGITSFFRTEEPANPNVECPCVKGKNPLEQLRELQPLRRIKLENCKFDAPVSSAEFCSETLEYLEIYNPGRLTVTDSLYALSKIASLRTLNLVRTDFVNEGRCYEVLARMTQLDRLSLQRTITSEKAPGKSVMVATSDGREVRRVIELDPVVMESLIALIRHGNLKTLTLTSCTALNANDVKVLRSIRSDCEIEWEPSVHKSVNVSTKAHDD